MKRFNYLVTGICTVIFLQSTQSFAAPKAKAQTLGFVFNTGDVKAVAFSPDGKTLADGRLYGVEGGEKKRTDEEEQEFANTAKHYAGPVRLWNLADGRLLRTMRHDGAMVYSLDFSPDGKWLAVGITNGFGLSKDDPRPETKGQVKVWNTKTWEVAQTLDISEANVYKIDFSPDGQRIAIGLGNQSVRIWNLKNQRIERTLWGHDCWTQTLSFSPTGELLALSGNYKGRTGVRFWNVSTGKLVRARLGESSVSWAPDGRSFATATSGAIKIWNAGTGRLLRQFKEKELVTQTVLSPDNRLMASRTFNGNLVVWDKKRRKAIYNLSGPDSRTAAVFSPDGTLLASGGWDSTTYVWNLSPATELKSK